jgi:hypothetical protein
MLAMACKLAIADLEADQRAAEKVEADMMALDDGGETECSIAELREALANTSRGRARALWELRNALGMAHGEGLELLGHTAEKNG